MELSKRNKITSIRLIKQLEISTNSIEEDSLKYYDLLKLLTTVKHTRSLLLDCDDLSSSSSSYASTSHSAPVGSVQDLQHRLNVAESILNQKMLSTSKPSRPSSPSPASLSYNFDFLSPSIPLPPSLPSRSSTPAPASIASAKLSSPITPAQSPSSYSPIETTRHHSNDSVVAVLGTLQESESPAVSGERRDSNNDVFGEEILVKTVSPTPPPPKMMPMKMIPMTGMLDNYAPSVSGRKMSIVKEEGDEKSTTTTTLPPPPSFSSTKVSSAPVLPPPRASSSLIASTAASKLLTNNNGPSDTSAPPPPPPSSRTIRSRVHRSNIAPTPSTTTTKTDSDDLTSSTPLMEHHLSLQNHLLTNLNSMSSQLKENSLNFSKGLEKDKMIMLDAQEKLEGNLGVMKKEGGRLGSYGGKQKGTTWIVLAVVAAVGAMWVGTFLLIKVT